MNKYFEIIKPNNNTTINDIKHRYRRLVKENHPDRFPEEKRREQNLVLMEINEAYLSIIKNKERTTSKIKVNGYDQNVYSLEKHESPDYAYYKYAFNAYQKGQYIFNNS